MSILDDAIREHLELKRAHGADEAELKRLEDEAFGAPTRPEEPDPFAEAPTEFLIAPGAGTEAPSTEGAPSGRREPNIADLQEAPPPPREEEVSQAEAPPAEAPTPAPEAPAVEEQPAMEHETIPAPAEPEPAAEAEPPSAEEPEPAPEPPSEGHSTQERHAIAEQPTELFDVETAMESEPGAPTDAPSPSDEELVDAEMSEPRLAPVDPLAGIDASETEPEITEEPVSEELEQDDFFSEQRLSEELSQALDAPVTEEHPAVPAESGLEEEDALEEEEDALEHESAAEHESEEPEDVLEDTPDFLEDAPEDDDLWFEQRPPKDFDFDD
ncbi:MAG: hypothetical protein U0R26_01070 [Solirubrobacterales bacterium]